MRGMELVKNKTYNWRYLSAMKEEYPFLRVMSGKVGSNWQRPGTDGSGFQSERVSCKKSEWWEHVVGGYHTESERKGLIIRLQDRQAD